VNVFHREWLYQNKISRPIDYNAFSGSCFLVMYKNLSITNVWPSELVSLIRMHAFGHNLKPTTHVAFYSDFDHTEYLRALFAATIRSLYIEECARKSAEERSASDDSRLDILATPAFQDKFVQHIVKFYG